MTKDVLVTISGLQVMQQESGMEPVDLITPGDYYKKNGRHYVIYDEIMEGFEGVTKNIIKIRDDCVDITKKGLTNVHMVFEKDKQNMTCYETPFGSLMVGINAKSIHVREEENDISLDLEYSLEINYEHLADCTIKMEIRSKESGEFRICS
ncbi:MAG: DUF1934 domain-containing protein [Lachnospiraceae bacterium]|nr:DUF1934 domain-containing protein [Lachnospiraceae bacterium]MDE6980247.1 DUF1934 domain-containing protein [Lachnospiraceae bacterium]